ncbi:hypothetical protein ACLHK8_01345 [Pediococcus sp. M21F004]|uniref:hypothetical protein n=1 Tax=Pediococcus sp. M21F004 TaxID=3390033 RepID=UPI003DA709D4
MAILGWVVFWMMIVTSVVGISYRIGKDAGIQAEKDRHNQVFFSNNEKFQYEQRMRLK